MKRKLVNGLYVTDSADVEKVKTILELFGQGMGSSEIAREMNMHQKTVWRILDYNGKRRSRQIKRLIDGVWVTPSADVDTVRLIMNMHNHGRSGNSIADELGMHQKTVWRIINRNS